MKLLPIQPEHLPAIAALEALCFAEPWSEKALGLLLTDQATGFAATDDRGAVIGYGGMLLAPDEGQILNLAVSPGYRRQGVGAALLSALLAEADRRGLSTLSLEVRVSNQPAVALYERAGFTVAGRRRHFYKSPTEDAWVMIRSAKSGQA